MKCNYCNQAISNIEYISLKTLPNGETEYYHLKCYEHKYLIDEPEDIQNIRKYIQNKYPIKKSLFDNLLDVFNF